MLATATRIINAEEIVIDQLVIDKIRTEERLHPFMEFGGWLLVDNGHVIDIAFDVKFASPSLVDFGVGIVKSVSSDRRRLVKGWFHKHPMTGLSRTDEETLVQLTKFWGECYTLVLQSDGNLLMMRTIPKPPKPIAQVPVKPKEMKTVYINKENRAEEPEQEGVKKSIWKEIWADPMDDVIITSRNQMLVGVTHFAPTFDKHYKMIKLSYPKYECATNELPISDLITKDIFIFHTDGDVRYSMTREEITPLISKKQIHVLMYTSATGMDDKKIFERDNVTFLTPYGPERKGTVAFSNGRWGIKVKKTIIQKALSTYEEFEELDSNIVVKQVVIPKKV